MQMLFSAVLYYSASSLCRRRREILGVAQNAKNNTSAPYTNVRTLILLHISSHVATRTVGKKSPAMCHSIFSKEQPTTPP
jgi:hypothetical protein